jgi:hypothetical protein
MWLCVWTRRNGEADEFHPSGSVLDSLRIGVREHHAADFDRADAGSAIERADDRLTRELPRRAHRRGVEVDRVAAGWLHDLNAGVGQAIPENFTLAIR